MQDTGHNNNGAFGLEFLRFGSSIPGNYWGCCACCIIQNFKVDPDTKMSIQMVSGDGGGPCMNVKGEELFAGPTYRDIFEQRIRAGTFGTGDMPNHAFFAILTESQVSGGNGAKWLPILKENGFEFLRTVCNSVYAGSAMGEPSGKHGDGSSKNYIFALFRNVGAGAIGDQFLPPKQWSALPEVVTEPWTKLSETGALTIEIAKGQRECYDKVGKPTFLTAAEVEKAGAPVVMAAVRTNLPVQTKAARQAALKAMGEKAQPSLRGAKTVGGCNG